MASRSSHNKNNSAVKRILQEARELQNDASSEYSAAPLESDLFEWHATLRGAPDTEFEGGLYHCRILLPAEYPFRPPSIMMLTPNGRFELNKKICISFTSYHEELWQPAWGVRTALIGLQGFFPHKGEAAVGVGSLEYPIQERKRLAVLSRDWVCPDCAVPNHEHLPDPTIPAPSNEDSTTEAAQAADVPAISVSTTTLPQIPSGDPLALNDDLVQSISAGPPIEPLPRLPPQASAHTPNEEIQRTPVLHVALTPTPTVANSTPPRPPILLDVAIFSVFSLILALLARRIF